MFQLNFQPDPLPEKIKTEHQILLIGSCFSENIGQKLKQGKWPICVNPFGTIYNPTSILRSLQLSLKEEKEHRLTENNNIHYSWDAHSYISATNQETLIQKLNLAYHETNNCLKNANWLIITLGSAWVYEYDSEVVANCHKHPNRQFQKRLLKAQEIIHSFEVFVKQIHQVNPKLQILLTVSPVRHIRDGIVENNQSKATLINSVHELVQNHPSIHYFPAYEIMIDELRDYRFYAEDMVHPTEQAIDYIWKKFCETCMDKEAQDFVQQWGNLRKAIAHRPFHPETPEHQLFVRRTINKLRQFEKQVDITEELKSLTDQLIH